MTEYIIDTGVTGCDGYCPARERIVRCKDCKWNEVLWAENGGYQLCVRGDVMRMNKPNGFCAWGERR